MSSIQGLPMQDDFVNNLQVDANCPPGETCSICMEEFLSPNDPQTRNDPESENQENAPFITECGHRFHRNPCLVSWVNSEYNRGTCPICRKQLYRPNNLVGPGMDPQDLVEFWTNDELEFDIVEDIERMRRAINRSRENTRALANLRNQLTVLQQTANDTIAEDARLQARVNRGVGVINHPQPAIEQVAQLELPPYHDRNYSYRDLSLTASGAQLLAERYAWANHVTPSVTYLGLAREPQIRYRLQEVVRRILSLEETVRHQNFEIQSGYHDLDRFMRGIAPWETDAVESIQTAWDPLRGIEPTYDISTAFHHDLVLIQSHIRALDQYENPLEETYRLEHDIRALSREVAVAEVSVFRKHIEIRHWLSVCADLMSR